MNNVIYKKMRLLDNLNLRQVDANGVATTFLRDLATKAGQSLMAQLNHEDHKYLMEQITSCSVEEPASKKATLMLHTLMDNYHTRYLNGSIPPIDRHNTGEHVNVVGCLFMATHIPASLLPNTAKAAQHAANTYADSLAAGRTILAKLDGLIVDSLTAYAERRSHLLPVK